MNPTNGPMVSNSGLCCKTFEPQPSPLEKVRAWHGITGDENRMWILASSSISSLALPRKHADQTALTAFIPLPLRDAKSGQPDGVEKYFSDPHSFLMRSSSFPYEFFALLALIRSDRTTSGEALNTGQS